VDYFGTVRGPPGHQDPFGVNFPVFLSRLGRTRLTVFVVLAATTPGFGRAAAGVSRGGGVRRTVCKGPLECTPRFILGNSLSAIVSLPVHMPRPTPNTREL